MTQKSLFDDGRPNKIDVDFTTAILALNGVKGIGIKSISKLVENFKDRAGEIFNLSAVELKSVLQRASVPGADSISSYIITYRDKIIEDAIIESQKLKLLDTKVLPPSEIPSQMLGYRDSPQWLFVQGNPLALFNKPMIGVVGTRQPSELGLRNARLIARLASGYEFTIVSGLAEGIDDEIHKSSLRRGIPNVAFLGHGIDRVFPSSTAATRQAILREDGAVVTEYFPSSEPQKSFFVQRNRLQALLSHLVIFVEAAEKSGTAHTFNFAKEYRREILALKNEKSEIYQMISSDGYPVFDVSSRVDARLLDLELRNMAEKYGSYSKLKDKIVGFVESESYIRFLKPSDVEMIRDSITKILVSQMEMDDA